MENVDFGRGILSQGQRFLSHEDHRLFAKMCWQGLHDYLRLNDERIKAHQLASVIPHSLDEDPDVLKLCREGREALSYFASDEINKSNLQTEEEWAPDGAIVNRAKGGAVDVRVSWVKDKATASNPTTILEVGGGWCELSVDLGRDAYQVTTLLPNQHVIDLVQPILDEEGLPVELVNTTIEGFNPGDTRFDAVLCCEVLEHVADDLSVLQKCCDMANDTVVVTVPVGSCEGGFFCHGDHKIYVDHPYGHVRAYSKKSLSRLLSKLTGVSIGWSNDRPGEIEKMFLNTGFGGKPIESFLVKLTKEKSYDSHLTASPEAHEHANA